MNFQFLIFREVMECVDALTVRDDAESTGGRAEATAWGRVTGARPVGADVTAGQVTRIPRVKPFDGSESAVSPVQPEGRETALAGNVAGRGDAAGPADGDGLRTTGEGEAATLGVITLPGVERSVACARRFVRDTLGRRHPVLDEVELVVSELSTNAVRHTPSGDGGKVTVSLTAERWLIRIEVTNDGMATAVKPCLDADTDAEDGRGLLIVAALAHAWGVTGQGGRTTVWAEFSTPSPMPPLE